MPRTELLRTTGAMSQSIDIIPFLVKLTIRSRDIPNEVVLRLELVQTDEALAVEQGAGLVAPDPDKAGLER